MQAVHTDNVKFINLQKCTHQELMCLSTVFTIAIYHHFTYLRLTQLLIQRVIKYLIILIKPLFICQCV